MMRQPDEVYEFDEFRLEPAERVLLRGGEPVPLTPKSFETLLILVRNHNRLVEKTKLLSEVWPDTFVEEKTLAQNIFMLRKTLGTDGAGRQYIQTVPRYGYRFVADVRVTQRIAAIKPAGARPAPDERVEADEGSTVDGRKDAPQPLENCPGQTPALREQSPADGARNLLELVKSCRPVAIALTLAALGFGVLAFFALKHRSDDARRVSSRR